MRRTNLPAVLTAVLAIAMALPAAAQDFVPQFRVVGVGEAAVTPDIAYVDAGAVAEEATAEAALAATSRAMAEIRAVLDAAGIAEADIQTTSLSLMPLHSRNSLTQPGMPEITGYAARNRVQVTVRDLSALGGLLDDLTRAGANELGAIRFDLFDQTDALDAARVAAVADAARKAALYAEATGVPLGPLLQLLEGAQAAPGPVFRDGAMMASAPVPLAEGTLTLRASVTLVYGMGI